MTAHYRHLTIDDRIEIQTLHERGKSKAEISRSIGVHRSTISREFSRGSWQPEHDHANLRPYLRNRLDTRGPRNRLYLGHQAHLQADTRAARSHQPYRMHHDRLVDWVIKRLEKGWTPQEISGRICPAVPAYFADPYSAWQCGTNEHFNGRIRKYLPKRTSFADLDQAELDEIITEINNRPRKVLGWATPAEVFNELCSQQTTPACCTSD